MKLSFELNPLINYAKPLLKQGYSYRDTHIGLLIVAYGRCLQSMLIVYAYSRCLQSMFIVIAYSRFLQPILTVVAYSLYLQSISTGLLIQG